jgi:tRNA(Ile)-lysidine synthase
MAAERIATGIARRHAGPDGALSFRTVVLESPPRGETDARERRHAVLADAARDLGPGSAIALGHTADDQVETLLMRLARGTGNRGLSGMVSWEAGPAGVMIMRPLLGLTRADIDSYLAERAIAALEDPTNRDPAFAGRNRVRHEAVPALRALNPRVADAAGRLAQLAREDDEALTSWAEAFCESSKGAPPLPGERHSISVRVKDFNALPLAVRRRVVRLASPDARFDQVEQVIGLAGGRPPGHTHLAGDLIAERAGDILAFRSGSGPDGAKCRICLTPPPLLPSMEREFGNLGTAPNGPGLDPTGLD